MKRPLITIGLTTFNASDTVERALISAFSQTWRPIEIVAVDDCSDDGTFALLQQIAERNSELRVFRNPINSGVSVSRNRILKEAYGEFIVFFDDDDQSNPERIMQQYFRIVEYEKQFAAGAPVICYTARELHYPNGEMLIVRTMGQIKGKLAPAGLPVAHRILMGAPLDDAYGACPTCSQMARLETYSLVGGFDASLRRGEDTDFNIRLAILGGHFVGIEDPLVIQTMTKTSEKSLAEEYSNTKLLLEKHRSTIGSEGRYKFCCAWINLKQAWLERRFIVFIIQLLVLVMKHPIISMRRLHEALPNIRLNRSFSRFHMNDRSSK